MKKFKTDGLRIYIKITVLKKFTIALIGIEEDTLTIREPVELAKVCTTMNTWSTYPSGLQYHCCVKGVGFPTVCSDKKFQAGLAVLPHASLINPLNQSHTKHCNKQVGSQGKWKINVRGEMVNSQRTIQDQNG